MKNDGWIIAETNFYKDKNYPQHFFCLNLDTGMIIDPLIYPSLITVNNYNIKSFRLFRPKGETMTGFSDSNMELIVEKTLRKQREISLGKVDEAGLKADVASAMAKIKNGNVDVLADILINYSKAKDNTWMKKKDCNIPEPVCPDCDCSKEKAISTEFEKKLSECEKAYKDLQVKAENQEETKRKQKENWDNFIKVQKERDVAEKKIKDLENEQILEMQEHEKALKIADKRIKDLEASLKSQQEKTSSGIDYYSASQLIALGLRKFLGIK